MAASPPPPMASHPTPTVDRSTKKHKTATGEICNDSNMEVLAPASGSAPAPSPLPPPDAPTCWSERSGVEAVCQHPQDEESPAYYMGDDDEEKYPGVDELFNSQTLHEGVVPPYWTYCGNF